MNLTGERPSLFRTVLPNEDQPTVAESVNDFDAYEARYLRRQRRERVLPFALAGAGAFGVIAIFAFLFAQRSAPARTAVPAPVAEVSAAGIGSAGSMISSEGRVVIRPGAQVTLGSESGGTVRELRVHEGQRVERGDVVAVLADEEDRANLLEAQNRLIEVREDLQLKEEELRRHGQLVERQAEGAAALDAARRDRNAARARLRSAQATVQRWEARLNKHSLRAPLSGEVINHFVEAGETLAAGAPVLTIADLSQKQIEAEVDEYDLGRIEVGSPVLVRAEGYENHSWKGTVEFIPAAVTTRRLKPVDAARPSDIRVGLVRISLSEPTPLKVGQRSELQIARSLVPPPRP